METPIQVGLSGFLLIAGSAVPSKEMIRASVAFLAWYIGRAVIAIAYHLWSLICTISQTGGWQGGTHISPT